MTDSKTARGYMVFGGGSTMGIVGAGLFLVFAAASCSDNSGDKANACEGVTCSSHGTCKTASSGGAFCSCDPGYEAVGLSCSSIGDGGQPQTCTQDGHCDMEGGETVSNCPEDCAWVEVACGRMHTCARRKDGSVWCWGDNTSMQLGRDSSATPGSNRPVRVDLSHVLNAGDVPVGIQAGNDHTCAITSGEHVVCWGDNSFGQLGTADGDGASLPLQVALGFHAGNGAVGGDNSCAVDVSSGSLYCWGNNGSSQVSGDGSNAVNPVYTPSVVHGVDWSQNRVDFITIGVGHICTIMQDGGLLCWGHNSFGQSNGAGSTAPIVPTWVAALPGGRVTWAAAGNGYTCAVLEQRALYCWGDNSDGQCGNTDHLATTLPAVLVALSGNNMDHVTSVTAGMAHACAVVGPSGNDGHAHGKVYCWGSNENHALGRGEEEAGACGSTEVEAEDPAPIHAPPGDPVFVQVSVGWVHTCAVDDKGQIWCWGCNDAGELGFGAVGSMYGVPTKIGSPATDGS
ncbi:MAG: hypothetical protein J7M25_16610 [Deltaproteobacteria bacterium]|nr:hypothetical protein [Deltaproteobacteria bacterium]